MFFKLLPARVDLPGNDETERCAFWNPCCGGLFNAYICYLVNLEDGCYMVDSFSQLRIVLHLYNAMHQRNLISGNIPLLTSLDKVFDGVEPVWGGTRPTREHIIVRFLTAVGELSDRGAKQLRFNIRENMLNYERPKCIDRKGRKGDAKIRWVLHSSRLVYFKLN
jgi:hypothetical protein